MAAEGDGQAESAARGRLPLVRQGQQRIDGYGEQVQAGAGLRPFHQAVRGGGKGCTGQGGREDSGLPRPPPGQEARRDDACGTLPPQGVLKEDADHVGAVMDVGDVVAVQGAKGACGAAGAVAPQVDSPQAMRCFMNKCMDEVKADVVRWILTAGRHR
eukprot:5808326-Pyramimonas_sp.AAC.1